MRQYARTSSITSQLQVPGLRHSTADETDVWKDVTIEMIEEDGTSEEVSRWIVRPPSFHSQKLDDLCATLQSRLAANLKYTATHRRPHVGTHSDRKPPNTSTQWRQKDTLSLCSFAPDSCWTLKAIDEASGCFTHSCVCKFFNKDFSFNEHVHCNLFFFPQ